jgi:endonuclease/exonuclease/phosphatase family metal-dependent hydrolase
MSDLRLATWNIRKCIGLDRRRDPRRVARIIGSLGADVVALQEADKRLGRRPAALTAAMVESETGLIPLDVGGHEASIGWHGNAVLLDPGLRVDGFHSLHLPGVEPRGALVVDLSRKQKSFRLVAVHLGLLRASRRAQLAAIRSYLDGMENRPTVVLGDFNEWSLSNGLEPLGGFQVHAPGKTYHAARPVAALDRIATSRGVELRNAGVTETRETRIASDHLPVWGDVQLSD